MSPSASKRAIVLCTLNPTAAFGRLNISLSLKAGSGLEFLIIQGGSLPYHKPKKKRKKRIPQEVLDEWRLFYNRTQASSSSSSSSASPPQPTWLMEARDPGTGALDSEVRLGEDSAEDEAFTCLDPFERDWDEMNLVLDDPH